MKRLAALLAASLLLAGCTAAGSGGMRASRPTAARKAAAVPVWPQTQNLFVGAGFIPPGALRRRRVPGTMQASSPTEVCYNAGPRFPGWPRHSPSSVGADSISARGCLPRRRVRRDGGIPPYGRPVGCGCPVSRVIFGRFVGAGFTAPAGAFRRPTAAQRRLLGRRSRPGPCGDAGFPGRCKHRPLQRFVITQGRSFPVCRGIRRHP